MKSLRTYVDNLNRYQKLLGRPVYDITDPTDQQRIADRIDGDLSPECLTCDGELSGSEVRRRYKLLVEAANSLKQINPAVTFYEFEEEIV
jgi:hypothetical protein